MNKIIIILITFLILSINLVSVSAEKYTYNPSSGMCEVFPIKTIICEIGAVYNPQTDKCEKYVESAIKCIDGIYQDGKCIKEVEPDVKNICTKGVLYQNPTTFVYSCITEPNYQTGTCISGSWNEDLNACVITPNLQYLCINGVLSEDKISCVITPESTIIPATTSVADGNKWLFIGGGIVLLIILYFLFKKK